MIICKYLHQSLILRHLCRLAPRADVKLRQNISNVRLDRIQADVQRGGNLLVSRAFGRLQQHLLFALRQPAVIFLLKDSDFAQPSKFREYPSSQVRR